MPDLIPGHPRARFVAFVLMCVLLLLAFKQAKAQTYTVNCGEDVHSAVAKAGVGATITFASNCTYRLSKRIDPLVGQKFVGGEGVILSGSRILTNWQRDSAGRWFVAGQTQQGERRTVENETICETGSPRCNYPEILCIAGDKCLNHVDGLSKMVSGSWYFDYEANNIYMFDSPVGRTVETAVTNPGATNCAICGGAHNISVSGITFQYFGTVTENAAVEAFYVRSGVEGRGWIVENNVFQWNGAIGAVVRADGVIRNNKLIRNGQAGYGAGGTPSVKATGIVIEGNEVAWNNWKRVNPYFSSGGGKISWTTGAVIRNNHVHDNYLRGIWVDLDNSETVIEFNLVVNNGTGLFLEMGFSATVRLNTFRCNGTGTANSTFSTSILLTNVLGVLIENNDITVCKEGNAIGVREDGNPPRNQRQTDNIDIKGNRITFEACRGAAGQDAYGGGQLGRVTWANNIYGACNTTYKHWLKEGVALTFAEWQKLFPSEVLVIAPVVTATPTQTATLQPIPATRTPTVTMTPEATGTPELTATPLSERRFVIEIIVKEYAP